MVFRIKVITRKERAEYMVYAVDFDGTLSMGEWPEVGPANTNLFDFLKRNKIRVTD